MCRKVPYTFMWRDYGVGDGVGAPSKCIRGHTVSFTSGKSVRTLEVQSLIRSRISTVFVLIRMYLFP